MYSILILRFMYITLFLASFFSIINAVIYSDTHDYDAYGTRLASSDYFVVLAQNDGHRYVVSMAPFGMQFSCAYSYKTSNDFVINVAVNRYQNSSQLSFVYLKTNSTDGRYQKLGLFTFSRENVTNLSNTTCKRMLNANEGERDVKVWNRDPSEMSTLQIDPDGKYAYGFLSEAMFIYDIGNNFVRDIFYPDVFSTIYFEPHALDIGKTNDGISVAILAGYYQFDIEKSLPIVYLVLLNPPYNMTLIANYTLISDDQKFVRGREAFSYNFDYVMSVSIHDLTQQVLIGVPQLGNTYCFSFNATSLALINTLTQPARSTVWLDDSGTQAGLLLSGVSTLPWAQSRINVINVSSNDLIYVYPNNQQKLEQWSKTPPTFIRLTKTYDYQLAILSTDGIVVLVPSTEAGYFMTTDDINGGLKTAQPCPAGTYKSIRGTLPCTICPARTKSSSTNISSNSSNGTIPDSPTINCIACLSDSFCPLASITDINQSSFQSISQAYAYLTSSWSTSLDDILMQNTFSLETTPRRCLLISPFFWALITLCIAFIILLIMGLLYYSPSGKKHFQRLEWFFRHSDLIGNGELWFGGLVSFSIIVLIIYGFWFGTVFLNKYPTETSGDANFACDPSLRNAQFSSSLQLLATIKSKQESPMFDMLDMQQFTMTISFLQTGYTCDDIKAQQNVGTYSVSLPRANCTAEPDKAIVSVTYGIPYHQMTVQLNLTGVYYIGGMFICLTGPRSTSNDSSYVVKELNYCHLFYTSDQTIGQTTEIYFALTKVINRTEFLDYSGSTNFSGIWIPTSTHGSLNDRLAYVQGGTFLRYLSTQHTVIISFSETEFYVINKQEPIARRGEIFFHNIVFTTTVIGIFALVFLIFKLTFMPIMKWMVRHEIFLVNFCKSKEKVNEKNNSAF